MAHRVADELVTRLEKAGVERIYGIVGDSLNPVTDAIHRNGKLKWIPVRHESLRIAGMVRAMLLNAFLVATGKAQETGQRGLVDPNSIHILFAWLLLSCVALAQQSGQAPDSSINGTDLAAEVKALREALSQTQKQLAAQQREIESLKAQSKNTPTSSTMNELLPPEGAKTAHDSASSSAKPTAVSVTAKTQQPPPAQQVQETGKPQESPLGAFRVGQAVLGVGGFVDFENVFRTTNTQSNIATDFGAIPFDNTPQGRVTEFRTTAQFSRLSLKVTPRHRPHGLP